MKQSGLEARRWHCRIHSFRRPQNSPRLPEPILANMPTPPHQNTSMETYFYNKNINLIEVQPAFIRTAMRQAKRYRCGIRILSRPTVAINPPPAPKHAVVDFANLAAYPELPYLQIEHDLESPEFINTDALYRFEQLETLVIGQPIDIDLSQLPALKDLRLDYHKKSEISGNAPAWSVYTYGLTKAKT